jgi:hypothetical protein
MFKLYARWRIDDPRPLHRLWSIRVALLWAVVAGAYVALPAFQDYFTPIHFALLSIGFTVALVIARITKQSVDV